MMSAVIFSAGAALQGVEVLSEYLIERGSIVSAGFGSKILAIVMLLILTVIFFLIHLLLRSIRRGWTPGRRPQRVSAGPSGRN